ncbi:DUF974-domain-containing protein [Pluteus cervinus]|uniref:DUF974-domain-containing protein n=1 Tax=Pluteus cervinus TaxID=181527 RepID=A0ACD3ARK6_9AGAR|nr:DUF974-domain-containing protein [Pluteus cervinus]
MASNTDREGSAHLLSLKVMRISRPEFASSWQPFYSSSPSFSAHSTASILSLQGSAPLPGHPKTLRDLTHTSELLMLPPSFGTIQLGEVFRCCLCVNNEANMHVEGVSLKIEMQTATSKALIAEIGGPQLTLAAMETTQCLVTHEIKELGQHVLGCTVGYRSPTRSNIDEVISFRKFYKFSVTNPLSVKTKVHLTRSPVARLLLAERDKLFMEVHIQNLTQCPIHFETMRFEPTDDWIVDLDDPQDVPGEPPLHPQDIRQYLYILSRKKPSTLPTTHHPGAVIALGRMELVWHSAFGEPGRLLTSTLSRRIPLQAVSAQPAPALPPHLRRGPHTPTPSRPQSPVVNSRPNTPPTQKPRQDPSSMELAQPSSPPLPDAQVVVLIRQASSCVQVNRPFTVTLTLIITLPRPFLPDDGRVSTLVVQVAQPEHLPVIRSQAFYATQSSQSEFSAPSSFAASIPYPHNQQLVLSPKGQHDGSLDAPLESRPSISLSPYRQVWGPQNGQILVPIGPSAFHFSTGHLEKNSSDEFDFRIKFISRTPGLHTIPGLRILLLPQSGEQNMDKMARSQILKVWDSLGTVWVSS